MLYSTMVLVSVLSLLATPTLLFISIIPIVGFVALPFFLLSVIIHVYSTVCALYLSHADGGYFAIPFSPIRVAKVYTALLGMISGGIYLLPYALDYVLRRIALLNPKLRKRILRENISYGRGKSQFLDVYLPAVRRGQHVASHPVIVFIHGGTWYSGSKRMYLQAGLRLRRMGYVVVIPSYTLWPQGVVEDMVTDIKRVLVWTRDNIHTFKGDPEQIYLMGHSAGAHLAALTVVQDAVLKSSKPLPIAVDMTRNASFDSISSASSITSRGYELPPPFPAPYDPSTPLVSVKGLILISGVYNIPSHYVHESKRGLERLSPMRRVMGGDQASLSLNSPFLLLSHPTLTLLARSDSAEQRLVSALPRKILLIHGLQDNIVPLEQSVQFWRRLRDIGVGSTLSDVEIEKNDKDPEPTASGLRIRCFRQMNHGDPMLGLLYSRQRSKYANILIAEVNDFISA